MNRRDAALALVALAATPKAARAQSPVTMARIGLLSAAPFSSITARTDAFRQGLRDLGYVEGRNFVLEWRAADDKWDRLAGLAAELVALKVAVIVTAEGPAALAARQVTRTIPIVMGQSGDPVRMGVVASLAHPGGNVTGLTTLSTDLPAKQVELIAEAVPGLAVLGALSNSANPLTAAALQQTSSAARSLALKVHAADARDPDAIERAFPALTRAGAGALAVLPDPMFLTQRARIAQLAATNRLPAIYGIPEHVEAGGLMAYAARRTDLFRRAASYVVRILEGAKPADLPVEQPTQFELTINMTAARALGISLPRALLLRADRVIG